MATRRLPALVLVLLVLGGCIGGGGAGGGPFPGFSEHEGKQIRRVTFLGDLVVPEDSLRAVVGTRPSSCRFLILPFCPFDLGREEHRLNLNQLATDVARLELYHRDHGYYGTLIQPTLEPIDDEWVSVDFRIAPGRQVLLRQLSVQGTEEVIPEDSLLEMIPLEVGQPFGRLDFLRSADTIRSRLLQRGHAYADILRNYAIDTIQGIAEVEYVALPGPLVFVDTILFQGNERLADRTLRRQLTVSEGDVLRQTELERSQRNLYNLDMVNFASIRPAPDTLQVDPELERATVLVQVVEAAQFAVETAAGFGTVECIRANGRWINRNFLGGGRRLEVLGSLSRIGVGSPADFGLARSRLCSAMGEEGFFGIQGFGVEDRLDYRLATTLQQPSVLGTQNQLAVNLHVERISEISAFIRESAGGSVATARQIFGGSTILSATFDVERGRTLASPAILCVGFDTCTEEDLNLLSRSRWSNSLSAAIVQDRTRTDGLVSRGLLLRGNVDWASDVIGSDDKYLRVLVEAIGYRPLSPSWMLAANVRYGRFLDGFLGQEEGYIPPERRFYAGGPNSVRGYTRNALGPIAYVQLPASIGQDTIGSATGGTQMVVGSVELRMPSPFMSEALRLATFVDAGLVSAPGSDISDPSGIRFTPGAGIRYITPVGPFRLDVAYNPYQSEAGPLYRVDPEEGLVLEDPSYRPGRRKWFERFRFQFALGQAF